RIPRNLPLQLLHRTVAGLGQRPHPDHHLRQRRQYQLVGRNGRLQPPQQLPCPLFHVHIPTPCGPPLCIKQQHQKQAPSRTQSRAVCHPVTQPSGPILTIWSPAGCQYSHSSSPGCARRTRVGSPQLRFTSAAFIPTRMVFWIMAWRNSLLVKERHSAATNVGIPANTNATATAYSLRLCMVVPPHVPTPQPWATAHHPASASSESPTQRPGSWPHCPAPPATASHGRSWHPARYSTLAWGTGRA